MIFWSFKICDNIEVIRQKQLNKYIFSSFLIFIIQFYLSTNSIMEVSR